MAGATQAAGATAASAQDGDGQPGKGGINRGRGDAAISYGEKTNEEGFGFKEQVLPQSQLQGLRDSILSGLSQGLPMENIPGLPAWGSTLRGDTTGGGEAAKHIVLPRHRGAVERYFARK